MAPHGCGGGGCGGDGGGGGCGGGGDGSNYNTRRRIPFNPMGYTFCDYCICVISQKACLLFGALSGIMVIVGIIVASTLPPGKCPSGCFEQKCVEYEGTQGEQSYRCTCESSVCEDYRNENQRSNQSGVGVGLIVGGILFLIMSCCFCRNQKTYLKKKRYWDSQKAETAQSAGVVRRQPKAQYGVPPTATSNSVNISRQPVPTTTNDESSAPQMSNDQSELEMGYTPAYNAQQAVVALGNYEPIVQADAVNVESKTPVVVDPQQIILY